jgi:septal ring factor EnvC (AmiA/AmiB activator)
LKYYKIYILAIFFLVTIFGDDDADIDELNKQKIKIEKEIKIRNKEINTLNDDLKIIEKKITKTTDNLNLATQKAIRGQKDLISIEQKINKNSYAVKSIESELSQIEKKIITEKFEVSGFEERMDSLEVIVRNINDEIKTLPLKIYFSQTGNSTKWEEKKYLKKLIEVEDENYKKELDLQIQKKKLYQTKVKLEKSLIQLEISLQDKKRLLSLKKKTLEDLKVDQSIKSKMLTKLKNNKKNIEKELRQTKKEKEDKQNEINSMNQLIEKLISDKKQNKLRTDELKRIRQEKKKDISGNFSSMKGKLIWPNDGKLEVKFGNQINPELRTITENTGIEIRCANSSKVISVLDGIVMGINYIPTYGNVIIVDHGDDYATVYANLGRIFITDNQYISQGDLIGEVSSSGSKKNLLHFEIWKKDQKLNPEKWLKTR